MKPSTEPPETEVLRETIINNPETYFTEEVMKQIDDAAAKEFRYGNVHSEV